MVAFHELERNYGNSCYFRAKFKANGKDGGCGRGFLHVFSPFAYVYGVFASWKRSRGSMAMIDSSTKRLVGL